MLDYLNQTLGLDASLHPWPEAEQLPLYLRSGKTYSLLCIDNLECLLIETAADHFSLPAFRKQMVKLPPQSCPIVLCFQRLDSRQRKALIEAKLPFIVPGSQAYLPFLGVVLQERMRLIKSAPPKLSATAQLVLLCLIYDPWRGPVRKVDLSKQLHTSPMNVTRAVQDLTALELVAVEKSGRCDYVSTTVMGKELYEKAQPYLINPVQKRIYLRKTPDLMGLPSAGESALAGRSMLNEPATECVAIGRKEFKSLENIEEIDPAWSNEQDLIHLEIWKYDPKITASNSGVDAISLVQSLKGSKDERIEQAAEDMMEGYQW